MYHIYKAIKKHNQYSIQYSDVPQYRIIILYTFTIRVRKYYSVVQSRIKIIKPTFDFLFIVII